jgi:hypothetical protein
LIAARPPRAARLQACEAVTIDEMSQAIERCEVAARALADACGKVTDLVVAGRGKRWSESTARLMDAWYVAVAVGRVAGRYRSHSPRALAMLLGAAKDVAAQAVRSCPDDGPAVLRVWQSASAELVGAASAALRALTDHVVDEKLGGDGGIRDDETDAAPA